jgi:hypothetical protein
VAVLLFITVYGIYCLTAFPSVTGGDSGELLAEACVSAAALRCIDPQT